MRTITAEEARTRLDELLDRVQVEPVQITRHSQVVGVMVSAEDYAAIHALYIDRLRQTMNATTQKATARGLTESELNRLLHDES